MMGEWIIHHHGRDNNPNMWRKEKNAHPPATCSAAAAPRAKVTPIGVHRKRNWPWENAKLAVETPNIKQQQKNQWSSFGV